MLNSEKYGKESVCWSLRLPYLSRYCQEFFMKLVAYSYLVQKDDEVDTFLLERPLGKNLKCINIKYWLLVAMWIS